MVSADDQTAAGATQRDPAFLQDKRRIRGLHYHQRRHETKTFSNVRQSGTVRKELCLQRSVCMFGVQQARLLPKGTRKATELVA